MRLPKILVLTYLRQLKRHLVAQLLQRHAGRHLDDTEGARRPLQLHQQVRAARCRGSSRPRRGCRCGRDRVPRAGRSLRDGKKRKKS